MKKLVLILAALVGLVVLFVGSLAYNSGSFSSDNLIRAALNFRFGNFGGFRGGGSRSFDPDATKFAIRWYPRWVSFGPDNDTLLVTLCHVDNDVYCRMAKYSLSKDKWDVFAYDEAYNYRWPTFSPDGQWIYYGATKLCDSRRDFCGRPQLFRMRPDGTGVEMFYDGSVVDYSFSVDGKRMIFWGTPTPGALLANEVHMLDIATRQDTRLTDMTSLISQPRDRPFLTADGEHFIFPADLSEWQGTTSCAVDPKTIPADPKTGKKDFGPLFGDKPMSGLFMAAIKDAPITKDNCYKLTRIWADDSGQGSAPPCAMDGQGRFLYPADRLQKRQEGNPVALALRPVAPNAQRPLSLSIEEQRAKYPFASLTEKQLSEGEGAKLDLRRFVESDHYFLNLGIAGFLRRIGNGAPDEAAFDAGCVGSLDRDGHQLAFIWGGTSPSNINAVAVLKQGAPLKNVRLIVNWPKLDLLATLPAKP